MSTSSLLRYRSSWYLYKIDIHQKADEIVDHIDLLVFEDNVNVIINTDIQDENTILIPGGGFTYGEFSAIFIFIYFIPSITTTMKMRNAIDNAINNGQYDDPKKKTCH